MKQSKLPIITSICSALIAVLAIIFAVDCMDRLDSAEHEIAQMNKNLDDYHDEYGYEEYRYARTDLERKIESISQDINSTKNDIDSAQLHAWGAQEDVEELREEIKTLRYYVDDELGY